MNQSVELQGPPMKTTELAASGATELGFTSGGCAPTGQLWAAS